MDPKKPECSYGISCFRKNPLHFKQLSHPQFEKLLTKITGSEVTLPDNLEFQCSNRTLLREQLEILRAIEQNRSSRKTLPDAADEKRASLLGEKSGLKRNASSGETSRDPKNEKRPKVAHEKSDLEQHTSGVETSQETLNKRSISMRESALRNMKKFGVEPLYVAPMGDFALKWLLAAPYHMFFAAVPKNSATWSQSLSVTFSEILDRSLGDIVQSLHTNMIVDFGWLVAQYILAGQSQRPKMTVFHDQRADKADLPDNVDAHTIKCPTKWGTHHAKISIFQYKDLGIRIVVSTANLYQDDWEYRTQGLWISPHLSRIDDSAKSTDYDSPTSFKRDFLNFLDHYDHRMKDWRKIVSRADCSSINVAFVASVPGEFALDNAQWGHQKLGSLLRNHAKIPENETGTIIVAQASSIGSLGPNYHSWIGNEIVSSMSKNQDEKKKPVEFKFIFPTIDNYKNSHDMGELSNCLCNMNQRKQMWIIGHMQKWKADNIARTRAIPHIKTFTRLSNDNKRAWWLVLGSGNLSKAAWGQRYQGKYRILSYEASVLFLPKFVTGENDFPISEDSSRSAPTFPMPYDLPLTPYTSSDRPFVDDFFSDNFQN